MDHYKKLILLLRKYIELDTKQLVEINKFIKKEEYKRNTVLLSEGDICSNIYFIEKGVIREYLVDETLNDITTQIVLENSFFYSSISYLTGTPSSRIVEALEDCSIISIKKEHLNYLRTQISGINLFLINMYEQTLVSFEKRADLLKIKRSDSRVKAFEDLHPEFKGRIPDKFIASYLNLAPETLSRLKAKIEH